MVLNSRESFSSKNKLIGDTVKEYPETTEAMKKYFGEECFKRSGFKIKTLGIACMLCGVDPNRLIEEIYKIDN